MTRKQGSMAILPRAVLAKGSEVVKVVGPTPVLHTQSPYSTTSPVLNSTSVGRTSFTRPWS